MIPFAIALALIDVFVVSQFSFWGAVPVLLAVYVYAFRYQASYVELVAVGAVYGFTASVFVTHEQGAVMLVASTLAVLVGVGLLRTIGESRLRIRMRGYDALLVGASSVGVYWAVLSLASREAVEIQRTSLFVLSSLALTLAFMMGHDIVRRKIGYR